MDKKTVLLVIVIVGLSLALGYVIGAYVIGTKNKKSGIVGTQGEPISSRGGTGQSMDYNEVITYTMQLLQKNPNDAKALSSLGDAYFGLQRFAEAIATYKKAIKADPKDVNSCNDLGLSLHYTGKSSDALKYIEDCIKIDPGYQRIWLTKGFILSVIGKLPEAKEAWETAFKMDPTSDVGKAAADFLKENK